MFPKCVFTPAVEAEVMCWDNYTSPDARKQAHSHTECHFIIKHKPWIHWLSTSISVLSSHTVEEGQRATASDDGSSQVLWTQTRGAACKYLPRLVPSIKINIVLLALKVTFSLTRLLCVFRWISCRTCPSPRQHCPKASLLWACLRVPRLHPHPWRRSLNPLQSSFPIACSLGPLYGGGTAAQWAKVTVRSRLTTFKNNTFIGMNWSMILVRCTLIMTLILY